MILARWTSHPAKQRPRDLILVAAVVLLSAGAVLASFESLFLTALSAVLLVVSVSSFLFPTRYTITDVDASEKRLWRDRSRRFRDLRRLEVGAHGALLSPFARKSWLDRHRGVLFYFLQPMVQLVWSDPERFHRLTRLLERRGSIELLLRRLEDRA